jgi:polar amino acid transport system substrate-binding protein
VKLLSLALLFATTTIPTRAAADGTLPAILARKVLRVGMHPGLAPFVTAGADADELRRLLGPAAPPERRASDGRPVCGLDVELSAEAARALGVALEIVLVERFDDLLPGLRRGAYDLAASKLTRTLERAQTVAFSDPYFSSGLEVRVRDPARFGSLAALRAGARVALRAGTTAESFARAELMGAQLVPLASDAQLYAAMDDPRAADAVIIDAISARDALVRGRVKAALSPVEERRFTTERLALAVRQGDPDWLGWVNLFVGETKARGALERMAARWNPWFRDER